MCLIDGLQGCCSACKWSCQLAVCWVLFKGIHARVCQHISIVHAVLRLQYTRWLEPGHMQWSDNKSVPLCCTHNGRSATMCV